MADPQSAPDAGPGRSGRGAAPGGRQRGNSRGRILAFMRRRLLAGQPPSLREVQAEFGFRAVQTVREHLDRLVAEGALIKDAGRARGYRLPGRGTPPALVPLLGQVQAGLLTTALEEPEGYLAVQATSHEQELFALRVRGDSMTGRGILAGDLVIVHRQSDAASGDVVVALVGEEATVKTLHKRRGRVELHPAHPDYPVLTPDPAELVLLGRVIEIRRYFDQPVLLPAPPRGDPS